MRSIFLIVIALLAASPVEAGVKVEKADQRREAEKIRLHCEFVGDTAEKSMRLQLKSTNQKFDLFAVEDARRAALGECLLRNNLLEVLQ